MYKVLIVEDEMLVRMGIKASADWGRFNMQIVADAANGLLAWEAYEKERPDVILTDIRMPVMDGLELISRIREKDQKTHIIILSCLEEFSLVQKAMKLGVADYILKLTTTREELEAILEKIQKKLDEDKRHGLLEAAKTSQLSGKNPQKALSEFFTCAPDAEASFANALSKSGVRIPSGKSALCVLEIDHFESAKMKFDDEHGELIKFSVMNIVNEILDSHNAGISLSVGQNRIILIFSPGNRDNKGDAAVYGKLLEDVLDQIRRTLDTYLELSVTITAGPLQDGFGNIRKIYDQCAQALEYKFFIGTGQTFSSGQAVNEPLHGKVFNLLSEFAAKENELPASFREEILQLASSGELSKDKLLGSLIIWSARILESCHTADPNLLYADVIECGNMLRACETLEEALGVFEKHLKDLGCLGIDSGNYRKEIVQAIKYIHKHYDKKITVEEIAEAVNYSPNYLCSIFRKETNISLTEYINSIRIKEAKKLLLNSNLKNYEIAEKVGFADDNYFARTFKQVTGVRPNDFKKVNGRNHFSP